MNNFCGDCGVEEGMFHWRCCDQENCKKCKRRSLSCGCYTEEEFNKLDNKHREPFFATFGYCCERCGKINFGLPKIVSDKEWIFICGSTYEKDCVLCGDCMKFIKKRRSDNGI